MNWKKIFTIVALTGFSASVATGQGTAPTIVQGDYISNVFGNSNFIKNPNAKLNTKDVTTVTATVTRSTTTPLVATSEFTVAIGTANGTATWATRAFDAGMKGQNCEARFSYRGFAATSKVHIKQGANTVASLNLTPATDPRIASINFPCGDLSQPTTFVVTDTAILAGTNEIGGIYVGLATNQANVAQAENVFRAQDTNGASIPQGSSTTVVFPTVVFDSLGAYNASTGSYTVKKAGRYFITARVAFQVASLSANSDNYLLLNKNGTNFSNMFWSTFSGNQYANPQISSAIDLVVGDVVTVSVLQNTGATRTLLSSNAVWSDFTIARFPTSSELVVTPERQNVYGGVKYAGSSDFVRTASGTDVTVNTTNFGTATALGKAQVSSPTACGLSANDVGFCLQNVPPGTYLLSSNIEFGTQTGSGTPGNTACNVHAFASGTSLSATRVSSAFTQQISTTMEDWSVLGSGVLTVTSFQPNLAVYLAIGKSTANGACTIRSSASGTSAIQPTLALTPLDQPSNSALYVQGPVLAAATGAAIPASYVGEEKIAYATDTSTVTANSEVDVTGASITLDPGVWELQYSASVLIERTPASTNSVQCRLRIRDSANNVESSTESGVGLYSSTSDVSWNFLEMSKTKRINITSSKTFKLSATSSQNNAIANCTIYNGSTSGSISGNEATSYIRAVRVN